MRSFARLNKPFARHERLFVAENASFEFVDFCVDVFEDCLERFRFAAINDVPIVFELLDVVNKSFGDFVEPRFDSHFECLQ